MFAPFAECRGLDLKISLVAAAIRGIDAICDACPDARIVNTDPLCRVVPATLDDDGEVERARVFNTVDVYQGWDILAGRFLPELGGSTRHLGIVGVNYYAWNQWELGARLIDPVTRLREPLDDHDPRRRSLEDLVSDVHERYGAEIVLSETSRSEPLRAAWLRDIAVAARGLLEKGFR